MGNFLKHFENVQDTVGEIINQVRNYPKPLVLFGAGYCCSMVLDMFDMAGINVEYIADSNSEKWGTKIRGISVCSFDEVVDKLHEFQVFISTSHYDEITDMLRKCGFKGVICHLPMRAYYLNSVLNKDFIACNEKSYSEIYDNFADEPSRRVFLNVLKHNISINERYYNEIADIEINGYFGTELFCNKKHEIIVDGGAFDGDTIREFFSDSQRHYEHIYAFEPDKDNYLKLLRNTENNPKITCVCSGLGDKNQQIPFQGCANSVSKVDEQGDQIVQIESIDSRFSDIHITFLKMDIEGSEYSALIGGKHTIARYLPTLAVCAYHKHDDLIRLPKLIGEISNYRYSLYLRHTFYYQTELIQPDIVIYAIAKHKIS